MTVGFIDDHRDAYGVEPICTVVRIAPSTYHRHRVHRLDPTRRSARAQRDDALQPEIQRVWDEQFQVYGPRKVWQQLRREGFHVARCTVRRLMRAMGLAGAVRGRAWVTTTRPVDAGGHRPHRILSDTPVGGRQRRHIQEMRQCMEPSLGFPSRSVHSLSNFW